MENQTIDHRLQPPAPQWSNRVLIAAAIGIVFLTLFPFRFSLQTDLPANASPFLLGAGEKDVKLFDDFLNVLLFVPFGFGVSEVLHKRGQSRASTLALSLVAGAAVSYTIEFLQIYLPARDSGWLDVWTNTAGCVAGSVMFATCGPWLMRRVTGTEQALGSLLTPGRTAWILILYFGCWFAISFPLQKQTRIDHWGRDSLLVVGNDASGRPATAWKGKVTLLQMWDHALPDALASALSSGRALGDLSTGLRAAYTLSGPPPFQDKMNFLPELAREPKSRAQAGPAEFELDGTSWAVSRAPVSALTAALQSTNQFAIHIVCVPAEGTGGSGRIVSISRPSDGADLTVRQENGKLVFWFRNALSVKRATLAWYVGDVFARNQVRDVLYSFDGSDLSLYVDGKKEPLVYELGPAASLAGFLRNVRPAELEGYRDIYYALVFFPAGILLGVAARRLARPSLATWLVLAAGWLLPPFLFEHFLIWLSGRPLRPGLVLLSLLLVVGGALWINADRASKADLA